PFPVYGPRFNEAAASQLRKPMRTPPYLPGIACFNEAAASQLRKRVSAGDDHVSIALASMRPQHLSCGNPLDDDVYRLRLTRFTEAAASQLRKPGVCRPGSAAPASFNEAAASQLRKRSIDASSRT